MYEVLWPMFRWGDEGKPELEGLGGDDIKAHFVNHVREVTDEQWANCDAIVGPGFPLSYYEKAQKAKIQVISAVGFDSLDLEGLGKLGIPACNTPNYGTRAVPHHEMRCFWWASLALVALVQRPLSA